MKPEQFKQDSSTFINKIKQKKGQVEDFCYRLKESLSKKGKKSEDSPDEDDNEKTRARK